MKINLKKRILSLFFAGSLILNASNVYANREITTESERRVVISEDTPCPFNNDISDDMTYYLSIDNDYYPFSYDELLSYAMQAGHDNPKNLSEVTHFKRKDLVITSGNVNFRRLPNVKGKKITSIKSGTRLEALAKTENDWYLVMYNGTVGYISGKYAISLLDTINASYTNINLDSLETQKIVYVNSSSLNIRCGAGYENPKIAQLNRYESVIVLKELGDWYLIITNDNVIGFIDKNYTRQLDDEYVIIDLSDQKLWLYENKNLILSTSIVTGSPLTPTREGMFKIKRKQTDRFLTGEDYQAYVNYWMPFDGGIGLHDASWRKKFGSDIYLKDGSHGCVNMPKNITDDIFENVNVGTKVLVHK